MRKIMVLVGSLLLLSLPALAQDKVEAFGGYSYARLDTGNDTHANFNGWNASLDVKAARWFGIVGDFGGTYGPTTSLYTYLFGPQISLPAPVSPFVHALIGGARSSTESFSDSTFATALGGGIDTKIAPLLSLRLIQADYLFTHFGGTTQNNARISAGVVLRF